MFKKAERRRRGTDYNYNYDFDFYYDYDYNTTMSIITIKSCKPHNWLKLEMDAAKEMEMEKGGK